mmetsp:Transcript_22068/g.70475  ORF Transcript_22068/g.70475 Transcript_22068/m.70475 type:complete len:363 (-) Transcript_22068:1460-2548(-)
MLRHWHAAGRPRLQRDPVGDLRIAVRGLWRADIREPVVLCAHLRGGRLCLWEPVPAVLLPGERAALDSMHARNGRATSVRSTGCCPYAQRYLALLQHDQRGSLLSAGVDRHGLVSSIAPADHCGYHPWTQLEWSGQVSLPGKFFAASNPSPSLVHAPSNHHCDHWLAAVWVHLHRDVLYFHVVLELQVLLRVRLHASDVCHPYHRLGVCHYCGHLCTAECRRLPVAVDLFPCFRLHLSLRLLVLGVLLCSEDQHVWFLADRVLLLVHGTLLPCARPDVRNHWRGSSQDLRSQDLQQPSCGLSQSLKRTLWLQRNKPRIFPFRLGIDSHNLAALPCTLSWRPRLGRTIRGASGSGGSETVSPC